MKKNYETPQLQNLAIETEDVITSSQLLNVKDPYMSDIGWDLKH